jgi:FMN phosphatase YigB (HAD superfamily)
VAEIKACLFDVFGTVVDWRSSVSRQLAAFAERKGIVNMAKYAGLPWDCVLGAETARAYKPRPEAYLSACRQLGLAAQLCA